ncbi:hypothetical protein EBR25_01895 [bacterium]|nr:hypothetical protein [bacterium]
MKSRIEELMFHDETRLPLLALVPQGKNAGELPKLRAALLARMERVEQEVEGASNSRVTMGESERQRRDERDMLKIAIDWIALQEDDHGK